MNDGHQSGIGGRLRYERKAKELTVKQLSEISGVPEKTIYRIETGEVEDPKVSSVLPIIKSMECSADNVLFGKSYNGSAEVFRLYEKIMSLDEGYRNIIMRNVDIAIKGAKRDMEIIEYMKEEGTLSPDDLDY